MKCDTSGTVSDNVFRRVLYFVMSSPHALSYSALGTALFTYAFSSFSTVFISAKRLAKSSFFGERTFERVARREGQSREAREIGAIPLAVRSASRSERSRQPPSKDAPYCCLSFLFAQSLTNPLFASVMSSLGRSDGNKAHATAPAVRSRRDRAFRETRGGTRGDATVSPRLLPANSALGGRRAERAPDK